jgi:hypothetical protein
MSEQPLACTLPADDAERQARQTRGTLGAAVLARAEIEGGMRLRFAGDELTEGQVREVIDAESRCCPFLAMELSRRDKELELTVTGPPEAKPMIEMLFA